MDNVTSLRPRVKIRNGVRVPVRARMQFDGPLESLREELVGSFNTFRYGYRWLTKLKVGQVVELIHVGEDRRKGPTSLGYAVVVDAFSGQLKSLLEEHAEEHHAANDEDELRGMLHKTYGGKKSRSHDLYTVVALLVLEDA